MAPATRISSGCKPSTSSRLACIIGLGRRFEVQADQRLGVRRADVEVPVGILDRHAVQHVDMAVGVLRGEAVDLGRHCDMSAMRVLISPEMKYFCAQRRQQLGERLVLARHQLEHQQRRDEAVVAEVEVAEVVVPGDLAAEDRVGLAHAAS